MVWKCPCGEINGNNDEIRCASCGMEITEELLNKYKIPISNLNEKNIVYAPIEKKDNKLLLHLKGLLVGVVVGFIMAVLFCYDKWQVRFKYEPNVFIYSISIFGVLGALFGQKFIAVIKKVISWGS
jgi:xanthosine utilization system XapX-like protein